MDGGLRLCIDYHDSNKLTVKNRYPLSRIDDIFVQFSAEKYFSKVDWRTGYHQVCMESESIPITTFNTKYGHFEFVVLPFGLTYVQEIFIDLMNNASVAKLGSFFIVYFDDVSNLDDIL